MSIFQDKPLGDFLSGTLSPREVTYEISYDGNRMSHVEVTPSRLVTESQRLAASKLGGDIEYDAAGRVIADASRGINSIEYNSDSHPTKIKFSGGNTQALLWDNMGNHISTTYMTLNSSLVRSNQSGDDINVKGRPYYFTETKRRYYGSGQIAVDDSLVMTRFPGGYLTGDGKARYYYNDYQGNNLATVDANGKIVESKGYYPYGLPWDEPTENPYLYGDKEYDNVHGLGEYYYGARQSVPVLAGGFTTIDPLCEKRPDESPYILCGANPIRFMDKDGNKPTPYEAAIMSNIAYQVQGYEIPDEFIKSGWIVSEIQTNIKLNYDKKGENGLQSLIFERTVEGVTEYAYAYAGTDGVTDIKEDVRQVFGKSDQYTVVVSNARALSEQVGDNELTFVGHSLGGGEAAAAAMATGRDAITFNAAALSSETKEQHGLSKECNITNYRTVGAGGSFSIGGCWLSNLQETIAHPAEGKSIRIPINSYNPFTAHKLEHFIKYFTPRK